VEVLFVYGGSTCLPAAAELLAAMWVRELLLSAAEAADIRIASAGLTGAGTPLERHCARAVRALGADPGDFRPQPYRPELADTADLVLAMTRDQRRDVLAASPQRLRQTFTLVEAAALLEIVEREGLEALAYRKRAAELARRLQAARSERFGSSLDDLPDPARGRRRVHEQAVSEVAAALRPLVDVLVAPVRIRAGGRSA
jgi:protein-tyrosine phosphatase